MSSKRISTESAPVRYSAILDVLGVAITSGKYAEGSVLKLEQLQQEFTVSRTTIREVMRILESMNLVRSRRRVGLVVLGADRWNVFDARVIRWRLNGPHRADQLRSLTQLRVAIEPMAASEAAKNASDADRGEIVELARQMRRLGEAGELEKYLHADIEFHALLLMAGGNEMFSALTEVVAEVLAGRTHHGLMPASPVAASLNGHDRIAAAVQSGDAVAAESEMRALMAEVRDALG